MTALTNPRILRHVRAVLALAMLALVAACAQPARVSQMAVSDNVLAPVVSTNPGLQNSTTVASVIGGKETNPMWTSQVNNPEFKEALERSLEFNGVLAPTPDKASYDVTVTLSELSQPLLGFDLTVTSVVNYRVTRHSDGGEVLIQKVTKPFTADFSSSLVAVERLRLANEGAIRENIREFLTHLGDAWAASGNPPAAVAPATSSAPPAAPAAGKPTS